MQVFDRRLVRRHRDRAAPRLAEHDFLLREVAERRSNTCMESVLPHCGQNPRSAWAEER